MPLFLTSSLIPVAHGFSTRNGGVSRGPFESLNLSDAVGDDPAAVAENLRRLEEAAGLPGPIVTARQVHGDRILAAHAEGLNEVLPPSEPTKDASSEQGAKGMAGDAVLALERGVPAGVRVADCVPVLLYDEVQRVGAAVHSGWRGTKLGISARAAAALETTGGAQRARMVAAIGPAIDVCCYEVSEDLAAAFRAQFGDEVVRGRNLDLRRAVELTLLAAGLAPDRIQRVGGCTACEAGTYFSHRRDKGRTGRHLAFILGERFL